MTQQSPWSDVIIQTTKTETDCILTPRINGVKDLGLQLTIIFIFYLSAICLIGQLKG